METLQISLAIAILLIVLLSIYIYRQKNCIIRFVQANEEFSEVELKRNVEVSNLKHAIDRGENLYENEKNRSKNFNLHAIEISSKLAREKDKNKKLETNNKQLKTKLKNANAALIEYNDDHFRNKRVSKK